MKNRRLKTMMGCVLFVSIATCCFGQDLFTQDPMQSIEGGGKAPEKLKIDSVPRIVTDRYQLDYPRSVFESWYGYPAFMDESDWYGYNPYLSSSAFPHYYIVEFNTNKTPYRAIYNKNGKKVATHVRIKMEVPKAVSSAINKGKYKGWVVKKEKEEMTNDSLKVKVYRIVVEKGKEQHALYYESNGKLVKDKLLKF